MSGPGESLLHLFTQWRAGATIVAGTGVPPADPVPTTAPRVTIRCVACPSLIIAPDQSVARTRLADHHRREHGG